MVAELDVRTSSAWYNVGLTIGWNQFKKGMSSDEFLPGLRKELKKYNGWLVVATDESSVNRVFFDTEDDMLLFMLRWA